MAEVLTEVSVILIYKIIQPLPVHHLIFFFKRMNFIKKFINVILRRRSRQHMLLALGYLPELPTFEQRDMYMRCLNALLRGEYIIKAIPKYLYTIPKHTISASQTVRFSLRNGPFCVLKRTVLEREMACISNPLKINVVQRRCNRLNNMNYLNNLLSVYSLHDPTK